MVLDDRQEADEEDGEQREGEEEGVHAAAPSVAPASGAAFGLSHASRAVSTSALTDLRSASAFCFSSLCWASGMRTRMVWGSRGFRLGLCWCLATWGNIAGSYDTTSCPQDPLPCLLRLFHQRLEAHGIGAPGRWEGSKGRCTVPRGGSNPSRLVPAFVWHSESFPLPSLTASRAPYPDILFVSARRRG